MLHYALAWLAFPPIYFVFGLCVAPFVVPYYASGVPGFMIPSLGTIAATQLVRSALFLAASVPLVRLWRGGRSGGPVVRSGRRGLLYGPGRLPAADTSDRARVRDRCRFARLRRGPGLGVHSRLPNPMGLAEHKCIWRKDPCSRRVHGRRRS